MTIFPLTPRGGDRPPLTDEQRRARAKMLIETIEYFLPGLLARDAQPGELLFLHQDAFAADLDVDEYTLLGMAIKYAGLYGVEVHIVGTNRETYQRVT
jgi:hypothetical protein